MFSQLLAILNNFTRYNFIRLAFIEKLYKLKIKKPLNLLNIEDLNLENLIKA